MLLIEGATDTLGPVRLPGGRLLGHLSVAAFPKQTEEGWRLHEEVAWRLACGPEIRWGRQSILRQEDDTWVWEAPFLARPARWRGGPFFMRSLPLRPEPELRRALRLPWLPDLRLDEAVAVLPGGEWAVSGRLSLRGLPLGWMALAVVPAAAVGPPPEAANRS